MKVCTKCKVEKKDEDFYKNIRRKRFAQCKLCVCLKAKQNHWLKSLNKHEINDYDVQVKQMEYKREYQKEYHNKNKDRLNELNKKYRSKMVDLDRQTNREWYLKNSEWIMAGVREYRNKRIEFFKQLRIQWDLDHPGARKEKDKIYLKLLVAKIERLL